MHTTDITAPIAVPVIVPAIINEQSEISGAAQTAMAMMLSHRQYMSTMMEMQAFMQRQVAEITRTLAAQKQQNEAIGQRNALLESQLIAMQGHHNDSASIERSDQSLVHEEETLLQAQLESANQRQSQLQEQMYRDRMQLTAEKTAALQQVADLQAQKLASDQLIQQQQQEVAAANRRSALLQERMQLEIARLREEKAAASQQAAELYAQKLVGYQKILQQQEELHLVNQTVVAQQNHINSQQQQMSSQQEQKQVSPSNQHTITALNKKRIADRMARRKLKEERKIMVRMRK